LGQTRVANDKDLSANIANKFIYYFALSEVLWKIVNQWWKTLLNFVLIKIN